MIREIVEEDNKNPYLNSSPIKQKNNISNIKNITDTNLNLENINYKSSKKLRK